MKKKDIEHPKLFFDYIFMDNKIELSYYSNKIDKTGKRIAQKKEVDSKKLPVENLLSYLNEIEYNKLLRYILWQEKVLDTYNKKGFTEKYDIIKESLNFMYAFKKQFKKVNSHES